MSQLTLQQDLVLQQKYVSLQAALQAGDSLDNKGMSLLQAGGLIVTLTTVLSISGFVSANPTPVLLLGVGVAFVAFLTMVYLSIQAWLPGKVNMPGTRDWDEIFNDYINEEPDKCFEQVLADTTESITLIEEANQRKGQRVRWSAYLLIAQVAGLLITSIIVSL